MTLSERRVVELAAAGGTSREIAQTLFVTEKTVETHLGRSFRKLEISSRRQQTCSRWPVGNGIGGRWVTLGPTTFIETLGRRGA